MTGIGHQVSGHRASAQPGGHYWNYIADHHHQVVALGNAQQADQASQEIDHLSLHQFGQAPLQAGVAQTTSAELLGSPDQVDACIPVGLAFPNQWKRFNVVSLSLQRAAPSKAPERSSP